MLREGLIDDDNDADILQECVPQEVDVREVVFNHLRAIDASGHGPPRPPQPPGYESAAAASLDVF